jgi:hypothetical protein
MLRRPLRSFATEQANHDDRPPVAHPKTAGRFPRQEGPFPDLLTCHGSTERPLPPNAALSGHPPAEELPLTLAPPGSAHPKDRAEPAGWVSGMRGLELQIGGAQIDR